MAELVGTPVAAFISNAGGATPTVSVTVPADEPRLILVVDVGFFDPSVTLGAVTYGGVAMSAGHNPFQTLGSEAAGLHRRYVQINPTPGTANLQFNLTGGTADELLVVAYCVRNVDQTTPLANAASGGLTTSDPTSTFNTTLNANDLQIGNVYYYGGANRTVTPSDTQIAESEPGAADRSGMNAQYGTDGSMNWDFNGSADWFALIARVVHDGGAAAAVYLPRFKRGKNHPGRGPKARRRIRRPHLPLQGAVFYFATSDQSLQAVVGTAVAAVLAAANSSQALGGVTGTANAVVLVQGVSSQTLAAITGTASAVLPISGSSVQTLANIVDTATATVLVQANSSQTLAAVTGTATAVSGAGNATSSQTLADVTGTATGTIGVAANASATLAAITGNGTATVIVDGDSSQTLGGITGFATVQTTTVSYLRRIARSKGHPGYGPKALRRNTRRLTIVQTTSSSVGQSIQTLANVVGTATATVSVGATSNQTLANVTGAATTTVRVNGDASATLGAVTGSATVTTSGFNALSSQTLGNVVGTANATVSVGAQSNQSLAAVTGTTQATNLVTGQSSQTLGQVTGFALGGGVNANASSDQSLQPVTGTATGRTDILAQSIAALAPITGSAVAQISINAQSTVTLANVTGFATTAPITVLPPYVRVKFLQESWGVRLK